MTFRGLANSGLFQTGIGQAPVSHLPWFGDAGRWLAGACPIPAGRKQKLTRPWQVIFCDLVTLKDDKSELLKPSYWIAKSYPILYGDKNNPGKQLWLDKVISEILKSLKMILCSSRLNLLGLQFITVGRMSLVSLPGSNDWNIPLMVGDLYFYFYRRNFVWLINNWIIIKLFPSQGELG
jgi:hypothetical protein